MMLLQTWLFLFGFVLRLVHTIIIVGLGLGVMIRVRCLGLIRLVPAIQGQARD